MDLDIVKLGDKEGDRPGERETDRQMKPGFLTAAEWIFIAFCLMAVGTLMVLLAV